MTRTFLVLLCLALGACDSTSSCDSNCEAAMMMMMGQGLNNASQVYGQAARDAIQRMPTSTYTHCSQLGSSFSCQQW